MVNNEAIMDTLFKYIIIDNNGPINYTYNLYLFIFENKYSVSEEVKFHCFLIGYLLVKKTVGKLPTSSRSFSTREIPMKAQRQITNRGLLFAHVFSAKG